MIPLTDKENKPYHKRKLVIYAKKNSILIIMIKSKIQKIQKIQKKYIEFLVPIKNAKKDNCKIKFIASLRFISSSLSNLVDNLSDTLHSDKCIDCKSYLDFMLIKDDQLVYRCFECK